MAQFIKSASDRSQYPQDQRPEVCLIGRSNVGKSSLINALANHKIALTSKTPGCTQIVNFYNFETFRLVDLPGYGYAAVNKTKFQQLQNIIAEYLTNRANIHLVLQVCDANIITDQDQATAYFLKNRFKNYCVVLNKTDKQNISIYKNKLLEIEQYLKIDHAQIILISALRKHNIKALSSLINQSLNY
jgi:GTP-binding protein